MTKTEKVCMALLIIYSAFYADAEWQTKEICLAVMFVLAIVIFFAGGKKKMIQRFSPTTYGHSKRQQLANGGLGYFCTLENRMCHQVWTCPMGKQAEEEADHETD